MTLCPEQTQTHPSFLPPFPIPFFISSSCFLPNLYHSCFLFISYTLTPFSNILFLSPFFPCFISFTYSLPPPFIPSSVRSIRVSLCRLCPSILASLLVSLFSSLPSLATFLPPFLLISSLKFSISFPNFCFLRYISHSFLTTFPSILFFPPCSLSTLLFPSLSPLSISYLLPFFSLALLISLPLHASCFHPSCPSFLSFNINSFLLSFSLAVLRKPYFI